MNAELFKSLFILIHLLLVLTMLSIEAQGYEGIVTCIYDLHQNVEPAIDSLTATVQIVRAGTRIKKIVNVEGIPVPGTPSFPKSTKYEADIAPGGRSAAIGLEFRAGVPFCRYIKIVVTMILEGYVCSNVQWIKDVRLWNLHIPVGPEPFPGHGQSFDRVQRDGAYDIHRFKFFNNDTICFCVKNLQFHYSPIDYSAEELAEFDDWMPDLYTGGNFELCVGDSMVHDLVLPYRGYLPHIYVNYELWDCDSMPALSLAEPFAVGWFHHHDYEVSDYILFDSSPSELFQDNFPVSEYDIESYVRADMARDISTTDYDIVPGDSVVVSCFSPDGGGIAEDIYGPRVYLHVKPSYVGPSAMTKPPLAGPALEGTYGTYVYDDGVWTVIQADSARAGNGKIAIGKYMFDLNDSLFTRGYIVEYYFSAVNNDYNSSTWPENAEEGSYFEFTCLPTFNSEILYVDDYDGLITSEGVVQLYFDNTFEALQFDNGPPDRYDVNAPVVPISNGPGSRAKAEHLVAAYNTIIWDSGDLSHGTICDGTAESDKSDDCQLLIDWINTSDHDVGLWILGDDIASELGSRTSPVSAQLLNAICCVDHMDDSYPYYTGINVPTVIGNAAGIYYHGGTPDQWNLISLYLEPKSFDIIEPLAFGAKAADYYSEFHPAELYCAAIQSESQNGGGYNVRTMWFGFSFMKMRDALPGPPNSPIIRDHIALETLQWMGNLVSFSSSTEMPGTNKLYQNYPNPFNPVTEITFGLAQSAYVNLRIYDVTGQLVRVLTDEWRGAGFYRERWDGRDDEGRIVASGVYFYRLVAGDFVRTKKMVLLR